MELSFHLNRGTANSEFDFLQERPRLLKITVVLIFSLALIVRIYAVFGLGAQGLIAERQFRSAIIARAYYFRTTNDIPDWRKHVAFTSQERAGVLEPPIFELMVGSIYRILNREDIAIARLLSSLFWVVGGIFLYKIAKEIMAVEAALVAAAFYLFIPLGVNASISFLPEPLMMMMFLFSIFTLVRYIEKPSRSGLVFAAIVSGLAMLVKPFIIFAILGAFFSLMLYKKYAFKSTIYFDILIFLGISLTISSLYYLYAVFIAKSMSSNFQTSFLPYLYFQPDFWKRWFLTAIDAVGFMPVAAALLGLAILRDGWARALVIGLGIGYIGFGLVYTYPIGISSHYHLQLIVIVALSLGPMVSLFTHYFEKLPTYWYGWLSVAGVILLVGLFSIRSIRGELASPRQIESKEIAEDIGKIVDHSDQVLYVATYYGLPLQYYAELSGTYWPRRFVNWDWVKDRYHGTVNQTETQGLQKITNWIFRQTDGRELSIAERFAVLDMSPEYFIITDFEDFNRNHRDLKEFLESSCTLVAISDQYLIYDVRVCAK